jgi:hypothetical protein
VGAVDDLVEDGLTGVRVQAGSVTALEAGLREVAGWDEERLEASAAAGRARMAEWTSDLAAERLLEACGLAVDSRARKA